MSHDTISHQDITYRIIGAAMKVHRNTPRGLREKHYQRALTEAMRQDGLIVEEEHHLEIYSEQTWLGRLYLDHWVNECVVVEDKAVSHGMGDDEIAQVVSCLAATQAPVGLLLNFGRSRLEYKRILLPKAAQGWQGATQSTCGSHRLRITDGGWRFCTALQGLTQVHQKLTENLHIAP